MGARLFQLKPGKLRAWQIALLMLGLFAVGAQQLVAQTHWHTQVVASANDPGSGAPVTGDRHDDCLLCQIAAHAGAAAPPATILRLAVVPSQHVAPVASLVQSAPTLQPAHAWQSRGPPSV